MICQREGHSRHNEIRDLQAELLDIACYDGQVEPALQPSTGKELARGTNTVEVSGSDRGLHLIFRYKGVSSQCEVL